MSLHFHPLTISRITDETAEAYTLVFDTPANSPFSSYAAGQYLTLRCTIGGEEVRRSYSLSSSPITDKFLSVTIKRVAGGKASNFLRDTLRAGATIDAMPPMGNFTLTPNASERNHYILIGAGSGITPLFSMLKTALAAETDSRVSLWYGNRSEDSVIFAKELKELQAQYGQRLEVIHILSQPSADWKGETGRLDEATISRLASRLFMEGDNRYKRYFLCGPQGLMTAGESALDKLGVNMHDVHHEYYNAPVPTEAEIAAKYAVKAASTAPTEPVAATVKITLDGDDETVSVRAGQSILDAAIRANMGAPYSCQSGICTACRAKLVSGHVIMDESDGLSEEELQDGYILTCQAKCTTPEVAISYDE